MAKNPRLSVTLTNEMKEYFEKESERTGLSQSILLMMIVKDYIEKIKKKE